MLFEAKVAKDGLGWTEQSSWKERLTVYLIVS